MLRLIVSLIALGLSNLLYAQHRNGLDTARSIDSVDVITSIILKPVNIRGRRDYKLDSISRRREYARVFAYEDPSFKDLFITKTPTKNYQYQPFQSSTSSIVGVDVLSAISFLTKKKNPISKLQKKLLQEENEKYVAQAFSEERVRSLTSLQGDSLQTFIDRYRPSAGLITQMNDYELLLYIKKSYKEFINNK